MGNYIVMGITLKENYKDKVRNTIFIKNNTLDTNYTEKGSKLYEGNWVDDKPSGHGIRYYENGDKYYEVNYFETINVLGKLL